MTEEEPKLLSVAIFVVGIGDVVAVKQRVGDGEGEVDFVPVVVGVGSGVYCTTMLTCAAGANTSSPFCVTFIPQKPKP